MCPGYALPPHAACSLTYPDSLRSAHKIETCGPQDWQRFIKQSAKFIELPSLSASEARVLSPGDSFGNLELFPLDDVVMGGPRLRHSITTVASGRVK